MPCPLVDELEGAWIVRVQMTVRHEHGSNFVRREATRSVAQEAEDRPRHLTSERRIGWRDAPYRQFLIVHVGIEDADCRLDRPQVRDLVRDLLL